MGLTLGLVYHIMKMTFEKEMFLLNGVIYTYVETFTE